MKGGGGRSWHPLTRPSAGRGRSGNGRAGPGRRGRASARPGSERRSRAQGGSGRALRPQEAHSAPRSRTQAQAPPFFLPPAPPGPRPRTHNSFLPAFSQFFIHSAGSAAAIFPVCRREPGWGSSARGSEGTRRAAGHDGSRSSCALGDGAFAATDACAVAKPRPERAASPPRRLWPRPPALVPRVAGRSGRLLQSAAAGTAQPSPALRGAQDGWGGPLGNSVEINVGHGLLETELRDRAEMAG